MSAMLVLVLLVGAGGIGWVQRQAMADKGAEWFGPQVEASVTTTDLPSGPLSRRRDASAVWTGSKLIVWGGYAGAGNFTYKNYADGAAYDPAGKVWTTIAAAPLSGREEHLAVWTGREMIVWGGVARVARVEETSTGAAYDPATNRWRRIADAPIAGAGRPSGVMWRGKLVVAVPTDQRPNSAQPNRSLLLYDPGTARWQELPVGAAPAQAAVYRDRLFVLGVPPVRGRPWLREVDADGGVIELPLPPLEPDPSSVGLVATQRGLALIAGRDRTTLARWIGAGQVPTWQARSLPDLPGPVDLFAGFPGPPVPSRPATAGTPSPPGCAARACWT